MNKDYKVVDVDAKLAGLLVVETFKGYNQLGFQRKLASHRISDISRNLTNGIVCPPLIVALINGKYLVIDGQHRLEAWKRAAFPLKACIFSMTEEEAAKNFVIINSTGVRVGLLHRLKVDQGPWSKAVRDLSLKFDVTLSCAHAAMMGTCVNESRYRRGDYSVVESKDLAERVLAFWTKDKRWERKVGVFTSVGIIRAVSIIASQSRNPERTMTELAKMDYTSQSVLSRRCGQTQKEIKETTQAMLSHLAALTL